MPVEVDMNCRDPKEIAGGGASGRQNRCFCPDSICSDKLDSFILASGFEKAGRWLDLFLELMLAPSGLFRLKPVHGYW